MALYDSENNKLLDTNDNVLEARVAGLLGDKTIQKQYIGSQEVKAIYIGSNLVYEKPIVLPQLSAPVISLSGDILSIEEVENAEYYDIYVDGVLKESVPVVSGFEVTLEGNRGLGEIAYVQINDDPTWYYAELDDSGGGFNIANCNIPNAYQKAGVYIIAIPNVHKIKFGKQSQSLPYYDNLDSTGDFTDLTFTSTGGSAPAYATGVITMTQDSKIKFDGDD